MEAFVIEGRQPLSGRVRAAGNKNGALPILAASLLSDEPVVLSNVPRITDVETMVALIADLGADIGWIGRNEIRIGGGQVERHVLDEASVMGTENTIMAAVLAEGETVIGNAACEPHVQDLCRFLRSLGARIEGIGSILLRIKGVRSLGGGEWRLAPHHI